MSNLAPVRTAEGQTDRFRRARGPFVVAAETSRMAMLFTDALHPDHPIVFANDSFLKLVGYSRAEVLGRHFAFLVGAASDPAQDARIREQFENESDGETLDLEFHRKDGGRLWVAACIHPVLDGHGRLAQHCISLVDLSAQMKRMRSEREALHVIYQHTPDFIAITSGPEHRFTFANAAYQRMVGPRDLIGRAVAEAFPELEQQGIFGPLDLVYRTGQPFEGVAMPVRLQRVPGTGLELCFVDFLCQPVRDSTGAITGMFWEGHDVTDMHACSERVQIVEAELIHLSRLSAMGTMAATLAHELTQPLTAIGNYAAVCSHLNSADGDSSEEIARVLTEIGACVQHGSETIRRLRDMTRRRKSQAELFDLGEAIQESIALVRACSGAGIAIEDRSKAAIEVEADRVQIEQVIMNLVRNACEVFGGGPGRVTVSTALKGDKAIVSVRDTGTGVAPVFPEAPFTWTESSKPEGMGIGLSICRTIVEAHGGSIWIENSGSEGSCFSFSLPVRAKAAGREEPTAH
jgi:two-component system sensor kinase FixL